MPAGDSRRALAVIASGAVTAADPAAFSRNRPSFYADAVGWLVTAAVQAALADCSEDPLCAPHAVGVVAVSDVCTALTMREIAHGAGAGLVSPLRFAGASPGILAGLPCTKWRLRGPSLVLSTNPAVGVDVAATVAAAWLRGGQAAYVLIAAHAVEAGRHAARCAVTRIRHRGESGGRRSLQQILVPLGRAGGSQ